MTRQMVTKVRAMESVSVATAKAHLSELVERVAKGDTVCITRRGRPVAKLAPMRAPRKRVDVSLLKAVTDTMKPQQEPAGEFIRRIRDEARY